MKYVLFLVGAGALAASTTVAAVPSLRKKGLAFIQAGLEKAGDAVLNSAARIEDIIQVKVVGL